MTYSELAFLAGQARSRAYSPISHFASGAALLSLEGEVFLGASMDCSGLTPSLCAERAAFSAAITRGIRNFTAIAVTGGPCSGPVTQFYLPCGVCRQVINEFCSPLFPIISALDTGEIRIFTLGQLLPGSFRKVSLRP